MYNPTSISKYCFLQEENYDKIIKKCNAFASEIRLKLIKQLSEKPRTIVELAKLNGMTNSTTIFHLKILEEAEIIAIKYLPGKKGKTQVCFLFISELNLHRFDEPKNYGISLYEQELGVGQYCDAQFNELQLATEEEMFFFNKNDLYNSLRFNAELLWSAAGKVTYCFSNKFAFNGDTEEISFSLEICSEAKFYRNDWKSNITFYVNGIEIGDYMCPADYGGIRGRLNPSWWGNDNTQYGDLVTLSINKNGSFVNNKQVNKLTINDINLTQDNKLLFTLGNKENSEFIGGFNIFGKKFGNYEQAIILRAKYKENTN